VTDEQSPCAVITILAVALFGALSGVARAELDGDEAAIRDSIYARRGTMVETLSGYVDRNTGTWNTEGLTSFASTLAEELEALDFEVEIEPGATLDLPGRPGARTGPRVFAHRPQRLRIAPGPKVLLVGHMDTVFEPTSPFQRLEVDAASPDHATGPGVIDMKGGLVVLLEALRALRDSGDLNRTAFTVLLDSDEEIGSLGSRARLEELAREVDYGFVFEPARKSGALVSSRRGLGQFHLDVRGVAAHAGGAHEKGRNAIRELAEKVVRIEQLTDYARGLTVNVGTFNGGTKRNIVPDHAEAWIDVRYDDVALGNEARLKIEEIAETTYVDGTSTTVWGVFHRPPKPETEAVRSLLTLYGRAAEDLGLQFPPPEHAGGGTDGSLMGAQGLATLDSMGPVGGGAHTEEEFILLSSLQERAAAAAVFLHRLIRTRRP
jgi:glutamate carboxypeptidase